MRNQHLRKQWSTATTTGTIKAYFGWPEVHTLPRATSWKVGSPQGNPYPLIPLAEKTLLVLTTLWLATKAGRGGVLPKTPLLLDCHRKKFVLVHSEPTNPATLPRRQTYLPSTTAFGTSDSTIGSLCCYPRLDRPNLEGSSRAPTLNTDY